MVRRQTLLAPLLLLVVTTSLQPCLAYELIPDRDWTIEVADRRLGYREYRNVFPFSPHVREHPYEIHYGFGVLGFPSPVVPYSLAALIGVLLAASVAALLWQFRRPNRTSGSRAVPETPTHGSWIR